MKFALHRFAEPRSFRSRDHFKTYVQKQMDEYRALQLASRADFDSWGREIFRNWTHALRISENEQLSDQAVSNEIAKQPCLELDSDLAAILKRLTAQNSTQQVAGVLQALQPSSDGQPSSRVTLGAMYGMVEAISSISVTRKTNRAATKTMLESLGNNHEERMEVLLQQDAVELAEKRERYDRLIEECENSRKSLETRAATFIYEAEANWNEAYNSYIEQLKTQTAVELWENRAGKHELNYAGFRKWILIFGIAGGLSGLVWIFAGFAFSRFIFPDDKTAQLAAYSAGSIILFTLFVWTLRVLVRSMISENHLATDASVRAAMAHTYLALTKEETASQEDRAIILASLFAPVSDGLVKDDGLPVISPASLAASALTNPRSG